MFNEKILLKIKLTRLSKGWTQGEVAEKLKVSIPTYSRFERGITKTDYHFLKQVCLLLGMNLQSIDEPINEDYLDLLEEEKTSYITKNNNHINVSSSDINRLVELFEKQQEINKDILKKLKDIQR